MDPERAKVTPFGGTVAHGFLTMSLLAPMAFDAQPNVAGTVMSVNYGFDRVRLMAPVRAGSRIRGRFVLKEVVDRGPKEIMAKTQVTVEIEGGESRPWWRIGSACLVSPDRCARCRAPERPE